jgi:hypothetical protein
MMQAAQVAFSRQATAFTPCANIFAPYYRQADAAARAALPQKRQVEIVAGAPTVDGIAAFSYYIKHYNHGRPFILAAHSQGSNVMVYLLAQYMHSHPAVWRAWGALEDAVRTGKPAFDLVNGSGVYEYLDTDSTLAEYFHETMATGTAAQVPAILEHFDFRRFGHIVDCGAGNGTFLAAILAANEGIRGTLFNTPGALEEAETVLGKAGVARRCDVVAGDFFQSVPAGDVSRQDPDTQRVRGALGRRRPEAHRGYPPALPVPLPCTRGGAGLSGADTKSR